MRPENLPPTDNYAALSIVNAWIDVERQKRLLERCTRFQTAPVLTPATGQAFFTDRAGFSDAQVLFLLKAALSSVLDAQSRELYRCLTDVFHVPAASLTRWRDECLGRADRDHEMKPSRDISRERGEGKAA